MKHDSFAYSEVFQAVDTQPNNRSRFLPSTLELKELQAPLATPAILFAPQVEGLETPLVLGRRLLF